MKIFPYKNVLMRYHIIAMIIVVLAIMVIGKAVYTMTVRGEYWKTVSLRQVRDSVVTLPIRGNIYSADGQLLATSLPEYKIYMDYIVRDRKDSLAEVKGQLRRDTLFMNCLDSMSVGLHKIFPDKPTEWFRTNLLEGKKRNSRHWVVYPKRISYVAYRSVLKLPFFRENILINGVHVEEFNETKKPYGTLASRTLGEMYPGKDSAKSGLQLAYDTLLRGTPGYAHRQKVLNKWLSFVDVPPVNGADIVTTIDVKIQDFAEKALVDKMQEIGGIHGVVLVMEVATGDVKAIVNMSRCNDGKYREIKNTAVSNLMEPGSVFKPMSFLVAFNDKKLKITDAVDCHGGRYKMYGRFMTDHNWHRGGYGVLTASECLEQSSNIGVSQFIDRFYHNCPEKFVDGIYKLGVAEDLHLDIPGYSPPKIRRPRKDKTGKHWANWYATALPWMSIGYETQVPPISVLNFYNGVANNGKMMRPRFVTCAMRNGEVVQEYPPQVVREQMASPEAIKMLQTCLYRVVHIGLGKRAGSKHFDVSGKTGTAQVWAGGGRTMNYLISFAGYFPSQKPKYSCMVCILKHGTPASGGMQCGPVFKSVAEMIMQNDVSPKIQDAVDTLHKHMPLVSAGNLRQAEGILHTLGYSTSLDASESGNGELIWGRPVTTTSQIQFRSQSVSNDIVPDVTGYGARDAVYHLERLGLKVTVEGCGIVAQQSLPFGHRITQGEKIKLTLRSKGYVSKEIVSDTVSKPDTMRVEKSQPKEQVGKLPTTKI